MSDVERQLRAYGDAIERASSDSLPSAPPPSRRGVFRGTVVAAAVVALALVAVGGVFLTRASDDGRARTASTRPRTRHVAPVTATVKLDKQVVHRGEDILGTVVFHNRTGAPALSGYGCAARWDVRIGRMRPIRGPIHCPKMSVDPEILIAPGRSSVRFLLPTGGRSPQVTVVSLLAGRQVLTVPLRIGIGKPSVCTFRNIRLERTEVQQHRPGKRGELHNLIVLNRSRNACVLDGAPVIRIAPSSGVSEVPEASASELTDDVRSAVHLRAGRRASAQIELVKDTARICSRGSNVSIYLPDNGGRIAPPPDFEGCFRWGRVLDGFTVVGRTGRQGGQGRNAGR